MLDVVTWKWNTPFRGSPFSAAHVNVLRLALERHLKIDHRVTCVTDDPTGIDPRVRIVDMPSGFSSSPRCRRRMRIFDYGWTHALGMNRILSIDLDVVIVDDLTPILERQEPIVGWRVGHAGVLSGSFFLFDSGALHGAWSEFHSNPEDFAKRAAPFAVGSDQAMLNYWLLLEAAEMRSPVAEWSEADGFVTYYGAGYERLEHLGVGPNRTELPPGARIVVLGSADLHALFDARYRWARDHWLALYREVGGR